MANDAAQSEYLLFEEDQHFISKFIEQMHYFWTSNKFTDISLVAVDGKSFVAHKLVLASTCPYFRKKLEEMPTAKFIPERINSNALRLFLEFVYNRRINISNENACDIHRAARKYQFLDLASKALEIMISNILPETSLAYWRYSYEKSIENLKQCCLEFIRADTEIFFEHHINQLAYEEVEHICSMRNLSCPIDIQFHYAINVWVRNDYQNRKHYLKHLLSLFNINFLPHSFVEDVIFTNNTLMLNEDYKTWTKGFKLLRNKH